MRLPAESPQRAAEHLSALNAGCCRYWCCQHDEGAVQVLPPAPVASMLHARAGALNINVEILDVYLSTILPAFTDAGDDAQYGSSAMYDVLLLQVRHTQRRQCLPGDAVLLCAQRCFRRSRSLALHGRRVLCRAMRAWQLQC